MRFSLLYVFENSNIYVTMYMRFVLFLKSTSISSMFLNLSLRSTNFPLFFILDINPESLEAIQCSG